MRKLLKKQGVAPKLLVTDKLRSYAAAFRRLRLTCRHEEGLRKNRSAVWIGMVALKVKGVVNRTAQAEEALGGSSRLENRCSLRSRCRTAWCEFSALLLRPLSQ